MNNKIMFYAISTITFVILSLSTCLAADYHVSTTGDDSAAGSSSAPWKTIQHAADTVTAGDTVYIHAGTYEESVKVGVSGSSAGGYITFQNYNNESVYLDGSNLTPPADSSSAMLWIENQSYLIIKGLEVKNYKTSDSAIVVMGIFITGSSHHIELRNNYLHNIEQNTTSSTGDAHGIAVYGNDGINSINNLTIDGNTIRDCKLGSSEVLVLNGNVETFTISNNTIYDCNNIAIDLIGWEGLASANDQARDGTVSGNTVYNITSYGNPAYGNERSAAGIYVDGGKNIVVERNVVHHCDFGVEVASEHKGKTTSDVTVRNNLLYLNNVAGITFGGYDSDRGITLNCYFQHNTLYQNDTTKSKNGEVMIQKAHDNTVSDNIIYCNDQNIIISNYFKSSDTYSNTFDYNIYYGAAGADGSTFILQDTEYSSFSSYQSGASQDANSSFSDPLFTNTASATPDFQLQSSSPAINAGNPSFSPAVGEKDYAGNDRVIGGRTDCGAYEYSSSTTTYTLSVTISPTDSGTVEGAGTYSASATATLKATAASGYTFSSWSGDLTGNDNPSSITMDADKSVTAEFTASTSTSDHLTRGSVLEVKSSEVDSSLSEFTKKPKIHLTHENGESNIKLKVVTRLPADTVLAELKKKLRLYEKGEYKGELLSEKLKTDPIKSLEMDGLYISVKEKNIDFELSDKKLDRTVYLEPPVINKLTGDTAKKGDEFTVTGKYFGTKAPKLMIEYLKNGDKENPKYKKCKVDKKASLQFSDAKGKNNKSCMVVLESDVSSSKTLGYSEIFAEYPKIKDSDTTTGYIILDNGIGLASYQFSAGSSTATLTMAVSPSSSGTTSPSVGTSNVTTNQAQTVTATAASGYTFSSWSASSGATIASSSSASTTVTLTGDATVTANFTSSTTSYTDMTIDKVKTWAYNIQNIDTDTQRKELVGTHFDMYVLEPTITDKDNTDFDIKSLVSDIRKYNKENYGKNPLIIAYVDVGQAENWRWYWKSDWKIGNPEWIVGNDPNNWAGNYPVAYWHKDWENIVIYGYENQSHVDAILKAGFDGIYMDWVEAFSDDSVIKKATEDGVDPAKAMFDFIGKIKKYAREDSTNANPNFLVIAQNAPDLYGKDTAKYESLMDAIALEAIWYDGAGGFDDWTDAKGYNTWTNDMYPNWIEDVLAYLEPMKGKMPIFCCEYAQDLDGKTCATEVYGTLAPKHGFIPYCTRRSLSKLSSTPYPDGYTPTDY